MHRNQNLRGSRIARHRRARFFSIVVCIFCENERQSCDILHDIYLGDREKRQKHLPRTPETSRQAKGKCSRRAMAALARSPARRLGGGGASSLRNVTASLPVLEGLSTVVATGRWRSCLLGLSAGGASAGLRRQA